ncbi:MAG: DUF1810 domain-containing protein [Cyanobacteria bacterium J06642_3]
MVEVNKIINKDEQFDLNRFISAQENVYNCALTELKSGSKRSHWMWFIFPQLDGLGRSATARRYAIKSIGEARAYLNHPILGKRLLECANTILNVKGKSALEIMGYPDDLKLKSSMTLFSCVTSDTIFASVLDKYFSGEQDHKTLQLLKKLKNTNE